MCISVSSVVTRDMQGIYVLPRILSAGHWAKVCHTKNNSFLKAMIDSGSISTFINKNAAEKMKLLSHENHKKRLVVDYSDTINVYTELDAYPMPNISNMINKISQYKYFSTLDLKSPYHQIPIKSSDKKYTVFEAKGRLYQFKRVPFGVTNGVSTFQRTIDNVIQDENLLTHSRMLTI